MFLIGLCIYISGILLLTFFPSFNEFIMVGFDLAPEISFILAGIFFYPLLLVLMLEIFKNKINTSRAVFKRHMGVCCSLAVSFGLIGTFIGLVEMISSIAAALSADEVDFTKKMALLLGSIAASLSSMSFAFITSILGVSVSSFLLVIGIFLEHRYPEQDGNIVDEAERKSVDDDIDNRINAMQKRLEIFSVTETETKDMLRCFFVDREENKNNISELISTMNNNNLLMSNILNAYTDSKDENVKLNLLNNKLLESIDNHLTTTLSEQHEQFKTLFTEQFSLINSSLNENRQCMTLLHNSVEDNAFVFNKYLLKYEDDVSSEMTLFKDNNEVLQSVELKINARTEQLNKIVDEQRSNNAIFLAEIQVLAGNVGHVNSSVKDISIDIKEYKEKVKSIKNKLSKSILDAIV